MLNRLRSLFHSGTKSNSSVRETTSDEGQYETQQTKRYPIDICDANFDSIVLREQCLVVVDFWADWCQPCTIMSVHMGFLLEELGEQIVVAAMDVEENAETPAKYGIQGLPTLIFFKNGEEVNRQVGLIDYDALKQRVQSLL